MVIMKFSKGRVLKTFFFYFLNGTYRLSGDGNASRIAFNTHDGIGFLLFRPRRPCTHQIY